MNNTWGMLNYDTISTVIDNFVIIMFSEIMKVSRKEASK